MTLLHRYTRSIKTQDRFSYIVHYTLPDQKKLSSVKSNTNALCQSFWYVRRWFPSCVVLMMEECDHCAKPSPAHSKYSQRSKNLDSVVATVWVPWVGRCQCFWLESVILVWWVKGCGKVHHLWVSLKQLSGGEDHPEILRPWQCVRPGSVLVYSFVFFNW